MHVLFSGCPFGRRQLSLANSYHVISLLQPTPWYSIGIYLYGKNPDLAIWIWQQQHQPQEHRCTRVLRRQPGDRGVSCFCKNQVKMETRWKVGCWPPCNAAMGTRWRCGCWPWCGEADGGGEMEGNAKFISTTTHLLHHRHLDLDRGGSDVLWSSTHLPEGNVVDALILTFVSSGELCRWKPTSKCRNGDRDLLGGVTLEVQCWCGILGVVPIGSASMDRLWQDLGDWLFIAQLLSNVIFHFGLMLVAKQ